MYVWIGCKLPESFEREIRTLCLKENDNLQLDTAAFELPQHISLKISFETAEHEAVLEDLTAFLSAQHPFAVSIENPSRSGNILWMSVEENDTLHQLHKALDTLLQDRFCIPQHAFDKAFLFHSTLFIDDNTENLEAMLDFLRPYPIARELTVDTFLLGLSETGAAGSYRVVRQIQV